MRGSRRRGQAITPRFPAAFRPPAFASWASCARRGIGPSLPPAYRPPSPATGPRRDFHVPHNRDTPGTGCPLYPGASGAPTAAIISATATCRSATAQALHPGTPSTYPGIWMTRHQRGFTLFTPPSFPSPAAPGWNGDRLGFFPGLHTPQLPATHARAGMGVEHSPRTTHPASAGPPICESTRTVRPRVAR
jgi:hypothetical protein